MMGKFCVFCCALMVAGAFAFGQDSSLFKRTLRERLNNAQGVGQSTQSRTPTPLSLAGWTHVEPTKPRSFKKHELITIIVNELSKNSSDAETDLEKKVKIDAKIADWVRFVLPARRLAPDQQADGDPTINVTAGRKLEGDGEVKREDKLSARITAEIVDIKPNGNLVLQAKKYIKTDEEEMTMTLTGVCRSLDVSADNTVLSTQISDLRIVKTHKGGVHDANRRGWLLRFLDWISPF